MQFLYGVFTFALSAAFYNQGLRELDWLVKLSIKSAG